MMGVKTEETCKLCGITNKDVLHFPQKVGGSDQPVEQIHCEDIDKCLYYADMPLTDGRLVGEIKEEL